MTQTTNRRLSLGLAALLCALLLPAAILAKGKSVPRPWEMQAYSEMVVSLPAMTFVSSTAWIDASHCGKSMAYAGAPDPADKGYIIAANGDVIFFDMPSQLHGVITGGTGRFEGASGEFSIPTEPTLVGMKPGPVLGTAILCFVWAGTGTISY